MAKFGKHFYVCLMWANRASGVFGPEAKKLRLVKDSNVNYCMRQKKVDVAVQREGGNAHFFLVHMICGIYCRVPITC